jgi:AcrR family transcriptional regulator
MSTATPKPNATQIAPHPHIPVVVIPRDEDVDRESSIMEGPADAGTPRGKIFAAATRLFAEFGYRDTNTRTIAKAAGVSQVMLHYYYGNKEHLYEAVLKHEGMAMLAVIFGADPNHKSPEEMLIDTPIRLMQVLHDNPHWASLLRREIADGAVHLRHALRGVTEHGPLGANLHFHDAYLTAVREGKAIELPIEAVRECLLSIGYSAIYLAPLISMINERDFHDETVWEEWKLTLSTILKRGLLTTKPDVHLSGVNGHRSVESES